MSKVCAVFGGSRGIGKAVAKLLVQRNYKVAVISRNLDAAKATTEELGGHLALSCDVAQEQAVQRTFEEIVKKIGNVNCLVNAAGINRDALLLRTKTEDILSQLSVNLIGSMYTCKVALRGMVQQQDGAIVNIVSGLKMAAQNADRQEKLCADTKGATIPGVFSSKSCRTVVLLAIKVMLGRAFTAPVRKAWLDFQSHLLKKLQRRMFGLTWLLLGSFTRT
ncbi:3-oxoacyl-[acyl-carrier-protein] reductase isoform X2 [Hyla sarda]|uniref:3-oxoacyl-[acyl-carrier-protein] reductase isoform X2 n=1 Tax=Hyla sarda TaxID=327740 RepID=UPI0024C3774C|nr:3-oxoacyl-[acyl-carrier-protein] reductase isoform X2 [Hyla sarda]